MSTSPIELKLPETPFSPEKQPSLIEEPCRESPFSSLRGVQWRVNLGILPSDSSPIDHLRGVAADSRRRYAGLRRLLLIDRHVPKDVDKPSNLIIDNPLSQNPDSTWGRFFRNAELEKMVDQDLSRLYPEHGSYFQTPACQAMLRRILLLWCLRHPENGYSQGMHELLAPLLYVLHADVQRLVDVRELYEDHFSDKYDGFYFRESTLASSYKNSSSLFLNWAIGNNDKNNTHKNAAKIGSLDELDTEIRTIILVSDAYGAEGELGILLSERFMEHDAYCMFDALMSGGTNGAVAMAEFFCPSRLVGSLTGLPPVIESSSALYHLLSIVDPSLHSHLVELGVEPQYFALRWLRVLFGREFLLEDLLFIWDAIFSSPNSSSIMGPAENSHFNFKILSSPRGAFISAMAVSMLLHLRSSLLATENATSSLQRLLNFPKNIDVKKLIDKARSLQTFVLDTNTLPSLSPGTSEQSKSVISRGYSLSSGSISPGNLQSPLPESYWEERWRSSVLHKEEVQQKRSSTDSISVRIKTSDKDILNLARTESDPFPTRNANEKKTSRFFARRRLLDDLEREKGLETDLEKLGGDGVSGTNGELEKGFDKEQVERNVIENEKSCSCFVEEPCPSGLTASEDNSSIFSTSTRAIDQENDSEKSSITTNLSLDYDEETNNLYEHYSSIADERRVLPESESAGLTEREIGSNIERTEREVLGSNRTEKQETVSKERKSLSGKFQWFWKFGRSTGEGSSEKGNSVEPQKLGKGVNDLNGNLSGGSGVDGSNYSNGFNCTEDSADKNMIGTSRNLRQSMLENIQVLESILQQDRSKVGSEENLSRNILGRKGQVTAAMAALMELRKISNLLSQM